MASRTVNQFVSDIIRETRGQATYLEAQQSLRDALDYIDTKANWEFLIAATLMNIESTYSTGTVAVSGTAVTLTGGTWVTSWKYKEINLASRQLPYFISSFGSTTTATLSTTLSSGTAITVDAYSINQPRYALPADCEPGRDLLIKGPYGWGDGDGNIKKKERMGIERYNIPKLSTASWPIWYTDDAYDDANKTPTIRFEPYPTSNAELRIVYYRKLTIPTLLTDTTIVPQAFERMVILIAASYLMRQKNQGGWMEKRQESDMMMRDLHARYAASPAYDGSVDYQGYGDENEDLFGYGGRLYVRG